jgi:hypothetical protein
VERAFALCAASILVIAAAADLVLVPTICKQLAVRHGHAIPDKVTRDYARMVAQLLAAQNEPQARRCIAELREGAK